MWADRGGGGTSHQDAPVQATCIGYTVRHLRQTSRRGMRCIQVSPGARRSVAHAELAGLPSGVACLAAALHMASATWSAEEAAWAAREPWPLTAWPLSRAMPCLSGCLDCNEAQQCSVTLRARSCARVLDSSCAHASALYYISAPR